MIEPYKHHFFLSKVILGLLLLLTISACKKDEDLVENVYVDAYVYLSQPSNINLNVVGGWVYINGGVKGIIVYRRNVDEYLAFERNCTYQPKNKCSITVDTSSNIFAQDACCGSRFQLTDGIVTKGPASRSLKQYNAKLDGQTLHIYN